MPGAERVRVSVHDALGRRLAEAFDGDVVGAVTVAVDVSALATGLYLVRIEGDSFAETRRLTVVR